MEKNPELMDKIGKWLVVLPVLSLVAFFIKVEQGELCRKWLDVINTIITLYAWYRMMVDCRHYGMSVWKLLASIIIILGGSMLIDAFAIVDFDALLNYKTTVMQKVFLYLCLALALAAVVILFIIPSKMNEYGIIELRKCFRYYVILMVCFVLLEAFTNRPYTDFVVAVAAYYFFRYRNEVRKVMQG